MGKAGFEVEIGGMQFRNGFTNCMKLAVFHRGENEFFRIETEGGKVLGGQSAYPEIISAAFGTKTEIRTFFEVIRKFCMDAGERTFEGSLAKLEKYAGSRATEKPGETLNYYSVVRAKNPSVQTNLNIPYSALYHLDLGDDFEKAKAIANEMITSYKPGLEDGLKKKLLSFFAQLAYQTYVYTKNKIIPTEFYYPVCCINEEILDDVESHTEAKTGTKASNAKLAFDVLIKTSQAEVLKELFTETERGILLAVLDNYKDFWGKKFENARGGQAVYADSYAFAKVRERVGKNAAACNGADGAQFVFTEPRMASIIGIHNGEIVIELRKDNNPVNSFLRKYCVEKGTPERFQNLFSIIKENYGVSFSG